MESCRDCLIYEKCGGSLTNNLVPCEIFLNRKKYGEIEHGKWITVEGFPVCSHCASSPAYCEPKPTNEKGFPPYCHECGRIMDEE